jgi:hypothetical protein
MPDEATQTRYVAWLLAGHVEQVLLGGASSADVVAVDGALTVQTRYVFPDRATLERYIREHAPKLRAEGMRLFGPETGVRMERITGSVVANFPALNTRQVLD